MALQGALSQADKGGGTAIVETVGVGAGPPIEASPALRFLERRRRAPVAPARAVGAALQTEVPGPRRAGLRRGVEAGGCAARPSRKIARRRRSKSHPAPVEGALRPAPPRAIEGGVAVARRPLRAPLRSTGLSRPPRQARRAALATVVVGVSRERPPAVGHGGSPRAARARNHRRR